MKPICASSRFVEMTAAALLTLAATMGCATSDEGTPAGSDQTREGRSSTQLDRIQFDDIPVPPGALLRNQRNESYSFRSGRTRVGRLVYWGRAPEDQVRAFLLTKMPEEPYGWRLASSASPTDEQPMVFEKAGQRCQVVFAKDSQTYGGGVLTTMTID